MFHLKITLLSQRSAYIAGINNHNFAHLLIIISLLSQLLQLAVTEKQKRSNQATHFTKFPKQNNPITASITATRGPLILYKPANKPGSLRTLQYTKKMSISWGPVFL